MRVQTTSPKRINVYEKNMWSKMHLIVSFIGTLLLPLSAETVPTQLVRSDAFNTSFLGSQLVQTVDGNYLSVGTSYYRYGIAVLFTDSLFETVSQKQFLSSAQEIHELELSQINSTYLVQWKSADSLRFYHHSLTLSDSGDSISYSIDTSGYTETHSYLFSDDSTDISFTFLDTLWEPNSVWPDSPTPYLQYRVLKQNLEGDTLFTFNLKKYITEAILFVDTMYLNSDSTVVISGIRKDYVNSSVVYLYGSEQYNIHSGEIMGNEAFTLLNWSDYYHDGAAKTAQFKDSIQLSDGSYVGLWNVKKRVPSGYGSHTKVVAYSIIGKVPADPVNLTKTAAKNVYLESKVIGSQLRISGVVQPGSVSIFTLNGRKIMDQAISAGTVQTVDLSGIGRGVYISQIRVGKLVATAKFYIK